MKKKQRETRNTWTPWEQEYGYAQATKVGRTVWISGQLGSNDTGELVLGMENQMQTAYLNVEKLLNSYGMSMSDVVEEIIYVTDIDEAFQARKKLGKIVYQDPMEIPSTIIEVTKLALSGQLVEIRIMAKKVKEKNKTSDKHKT